jgi:hypothetical protein
MPPDWYMIRPRWWRLWDWYYKIRVVLILFKDSLLEFFADPKSGPYSIHPITHACNDSPIPPNLELIMDHYTQVLVSLRSRTFPFWTIVPHELETTHASNASVYSVDFWDNANER